ncbi:MAG TPA: hypothetical protein VJ302_02910 [Blastocatellia bacterium]|nr:hypothetical protein [Blastocatellia bacterium]
MRVQTYRPKIQNGPVNRQRSRTSGAKVSERRATSRRTSQGAAGSKATESGRRNGGNFLWTLMVIGAVVGGGFIFALRSQITTHQLSQAEAQLRTELDEMATRQRYEMQQQQRALSPRESDRTARVAGLYQPKLNQADVKASPAAGARAQAAPSPKTKRENVKERQPARAASRR